MAASRTEARGARRAPELAPGAAVFGYGRDSGGREQERSLADQRAAVEVFCRQQGYELRAWYGDEALPGSDAERRPGFQELVAACRAEPPPVAAVVVWDLARLSRAALDRQFYLADLRRRGVQVLSLRADENLAAANPMGQVIESVLAFKDEQYLHDMARNVSRGMAASAAAGRTHGNRPPAGYRRTQIVIGQHRDGTPRQVQRWAVDEATAPLVREVFRLYAAGVGLTEIHARVHLLTYFSGYRALLRNPLYVGVVRIGAARFQDEALRIVDDATWQAVQARRQTPLPGRRVSSPYLLSGLLVCGRCGYVMHGRELRSGWQPEKGLFNRYYRCSNGRRPGHYCNTATRCEPVDAAVLQTVAARLAEPAQVATLVAELAARAAADPRPAQARALAEALGRVERAIAGLLDLAETGTVAVPEIRRRLAEREAELAALRSERATLMAAPLPAPFDAEAVRALLAEALMRLQAGEDIPAMRRALAALVERVVFMPPNGVDIVYRGEVGRIA